MRTALESTPRAEQVAPYSERLSANVHVNTPRAQVELVRKYGPIGLDPCGNSTSVVGAREEFWGPAPVCRACGRPASLAPRPDKRQLHLGAWAKVSLATVDSCAACEEKAVATGEPPRMAVPAKVLSDERFGRDGLELSWREWVRPGEVVFLQPPYGRLIVPWIGKANEEAANGLEIIGLLPGRFDTAWFRSMRADRICWYAHRIAFDDSSEPDRDDTAKFPSVFVYWGANRERFRRVFGPHGVVTPWRPVRGIVL